MNKFFTAISLLCACLFTSCSAFNDSGQDIDSDTMSKKGNPSEATNTDEHPTVRNIESTPATSGVSEDRISKKNPRNGRTVSGFIEPDVTQLPNNKDLQESTNIAPKTNQLTPEIIDPNDSLPSIQ